MLVVVIGASAGVAFANWYSAEGYLMLGGKMGLPESAKPTLTAGEKSLLFAVFVMVGALLGFVIERFTFYQIQRSKERYGQMTGQEKMLFVLGLIMGLLLTALIKGILPTPIYVIVPIAFVMCYVCVAAMNSLKEQIQFYVPQPGAGDISKIKKAFVRPKLMDTNVIIDGRILDICKAGFVEGPIYVPKFVLEELQQIADSGDSLKRARGRRGLEVLNLMQKEMELEVPDFKSDNMTMEVDARLVLVAKEIGGLIITNDYNLNRVAVLQGVDVLNINELANALKPVVLPGEEMNVTIIKEGKEKDQGIGYLDDGTMIVVEGARRLIGETLDVAVTSVLQTVQGKMIFTKLRDNTEQDSDSGDRGYRSSTGSRPRTKTR